MQFHDTRLPRAIRRRGFIKGAAAVGAATLAMPNIVAAQNKAPIKIGMPSVFSGLLSVLGQSSRAGVLMEIDKVNEAGGIGGRKLELITRDSKGKPDEATKVVRDGQAGIQVCVDDAMKNNEDIPAKLRVTLSVGLKGTVEKAVINDAVVNASSIGSCITKTARKWKFAPPTEPADIDIPLVLR